VSGILQLYSPLVPLSTPAVEQVKLTQSTEVKASLLCIDSLLHSASFFALIGEVT
jgi:hypothetical protein